MRRALMGAAAAAASLTFMTAPAAAGGDVVQIACGNLVFDVTVNGSGQWSPGRAVGTKKVLHPTSFRDVHGSVTFKDGSGSDEFSEPDATFAAEPQAVNGKTTLVDCTFSDDFEDAYVVGHIEGIVSGWIS